MDRSGTYEPRRAGRREISAGETSDTELVLQFQRGDPCTREAAYERLFERYNPEIRNYAASLSGNVHDGEDISQITFMRVLMNLDKLDARSGNFKSWIYTIARNLAIDGYRLRQKRHAISIHSLDYPASDVADKKTPNPVDACRGIEALAALEKAMEGLDPKSRNTMQSYSLGSSYGEIARQSHTPTGTIKSRMRTARLRLEAALA
jgi:RNA polymerase sigma-70 factor (ECF subfamily)